jgi:hypothetical protein
MRAASILVRMPPRENSEAAPPAIASMAGVTRSTSRISVAPEALDVGEQDQEIGARHRRHARGEAVVVAVADLAGRDRVVLVDDGDGAHRAEPRQRLARVEIAAALLGVVEGDEHLSRDDPSCRESFRPGPRQGDLADGGGGLAVLQAQGAARKPQHRAPQRNGARRDDQHLGAAPVQSGDVLRQRVEPSLFERAGRAVDQQRGADLDHDFLELAKLGEIRHRF